MLSLARLLVCPTSLTIVVGLHLSGFGLAWCKSILMRVQNPKQYTFYRLFVCFSEVPFSLKLSCRVPLTKKFGKRCTRRPLTITTVLMSDKSENFKCIKKSVTNVIALLI